MDFSINKLHSVTHFGLLWIVILVVIQWTKGENYCDTDTQNPSEVMMEVFHQSTDDLHCTARSENSVIAEMYHCVNGTGILLDNCRRGQSTNIGRVSTSCSVTVDVQNMSETFFCVERALFGQVNQLSAHFSVVVQGSNVTAQTGSPTATGVELIFTSNSAFMEQKNSTTATPRRNSGRSQNRTPVGVQVAMIALISILSTSCYQHDCMIDKRYLVYIYKHSNKKDTFCELQEKQTSDAVLYSSN